MFAMYFGGNVSRLIYKEEVVQMRGQQSVSLLARSQAYVPLSPPVLSTAIQFAIFIHISN